MPKRCEEPSCGNLIRRNVEPERVGDKCFCSEECAKLFVQQSATFEAATDPFHHPFERRTQKRMNGG